MVVSTRDAGDTPPPAPAAVVLNALRRDTRPALTVPELTAAVRGSGIDVEGTLQALHELGVVVVVDHPAPDHHLGGTDLRTVAAVDDRSSAPVADAQARAEARWAEFLRAFLASHRCS